MVKPEYFSVTLEWYWHQPLCVFLRPQVTECTWISPVACPPAPSLPCRHSRQRLLAHVLGFSVDSWAFSNMIPCSALLPPSTSCISVCIYTACVCMWEWLWTSIHTHVFNMRGATFVGFSLKNLADKSAISASRPMKTNVCVCVCVTKNQHKPKTTKTCVTKS